MEIVCPQCAFSRDVPEDRLPKSSAIANCPRCGCRFRFSAERGVLEILEHKNTENADKASLPAQNECDGDDPLPPVAIVPGAVQKLQNAGDENTDVSDSGNSDGPTNKKYIETEDANIRIIASSPQDTPQQESVTEETRAGHVQGEQDGNPWLLAPYPDGWLVAFYQTMQRIMLSSTRFFATLQPSISHNRALMFYLVVCIVETCMDRLWGSVLRSVLEPGMANDPQLSALLDLLTPDSNPVLSALKNTAVLLLQAYLFTGLMFVVYRLVAGNHVNFSVVFQVVTYSVAPHMLCVVPVLGILVGTIWSIGCLVVGMRVALRMNWGQTLAGFLPVIILVLATVQHILQIAK